MNPRLVLKVDGTRPLVDGPGEVGGIMEFSVTGKLSEEREGQKIPLDS